MLTFEQARGAAGLGGTVYDRARHRVVEGNHWIASVRQHARDNGVFGWDKLFLYHHLLADTFVLAMWATKPGASDLPAVMLELMALAGPPGHTIYNGRKLGPPPDMDRVLRRLAPASLHAREFRRREDEEQSKRAREAGANLELRARVAHGLEPGAAELVLSGAIPVDSREDDIESSIRTGKRPTILVNGNKNGQ